MADVTPNTCPTCGGTGEVDNVICRTCYGRSTVPVRGLSFELIKEQLDFFDTASDKLDSIIAEQADQRAELTDAITNIIGKLNTIIAAVT